MNAYIYQADLHCEECTKKVKATLPEPSIYEWEYDSDYYPKGPYPNGGGEADTPNHCGTCHVFLENPLTHEGELYVRNTEKPDPKWVTHYDYLHLDAAVNIFTLAPGEKKVFMSTDNTEKVTITRINQVMGKILLESDISIDTITGTLSFLQREIAHLDLGKEL